MEGLTKLATGSKKSVEGFAFVQSSMVFNVRPELQDHNIHSPAKSDATKTSWRNVRYFKTYLVLGATSTGAQTIPALANAVRLARVTLVMVLMNSSES
jgi:hypothetical protein